MRGGSVKSTWSEMQQLRNRVRDLEMMRERLSRLYFSQVETGKARMEKLHRILEVVTRLNSSLDIDSLLSQIVGAVQKSLGFRSCCCASSIPRRVRCARARSPDCPTSRSASSRTRTSALATFQSWLADEFRGQPLVLHQSQAQLREPAAGRRRARSGCARGLGVARRGRPLRAALHARPANSWPTCPSTTRSTAWCRAARRSRCSKCSATTSSSPLENARLVQSLAQHGRELEAANRRMGELNALKSSFLSAVSHELRTPLTSIRAYLDSLRDDLDRPGLEAPLRFVGILEEEARRLSDLIDSVLSFSHLERGSNPMEFKALDVACAGPDRRPKRCFRWPRPRRFPYRRTSRMPTSGSRRTSNC
jgi:hypothetical protein